MLYSQSYAFYSIVHEIHTISVMIKLLSIQSKILLTLYFHSSLTALKRLFFCGILMQVTKDLRKNVFFGYFQIQKTAITSPLKEKVMTIQYQKMLYRLSELE